jgi:adenosylhomocysteine nucleosidase
MIVVPGLLFSAFAASAMAVQTSEPVPPEALAASAEHVVVLVSADAEWKAVLQILPGRPISHTPFGDWFRTRLRGYNEAVLFFHGGWGKIRAAASTQYAIDRWKPRLLVNLGTCGGFAGAITKRDVILVDRTVVYDIIERMGDPSEAIREYTTLLDVSWVGELPTGVMRGPLLSADQDISPGEVARLRRQFDAVAADWESGAIAFVARTNGTPVLILRGVSDLVSETGGEAYGEPSVFQSGAREVMTNLIERLAFWLVRWEASGKGRGEVP